MFTMKMSIPSVDGFIKIEKSTPGEDNHAIMSKVTNWLLMNACRSGDLEKVMTILQHVNSSDYPGGSEGYALLSRTLESNRGKTKEIAKLLLQHGAKVNSETSALKGMPDTPLHHAVLTESVEIVVMLLNHGAAVNTRNENKAMPLHLAIGNESEEIVQLLLNRGANLETSRSDGYRPLHLAACKRNVKVIQHLLNYGAEVNSVCTYICGNNSYKYTALYLAADKNIDAVKLLLEHGANVNHVSTHTNQNTKRNTSVLEKAVRFGSNDTVELLLQYGATINSTCDSSSKLLHIAARLGSAKKVQLLLKNNNEIEGKDEEGFTVLHKAVESGKTEIVLLLLKKGCSVNSAANSGMTPLSTAAAKGDTRLVQILLDQNASIDTKDAKGFSALHKAVEKDNKDIVQMLLDKGSFINATTTSMTTPLHIAVRKQNESMVKLLLNLGASVDGEDKDNKTALCFAVEGDIEILQLLLSRKPQVENENNKSALRLSVLGKRKQVKMVEKLLSYGFTIRSEDIEDEELFRASVEGGNIELVQYILQHNSKLERASTVVNLAVVNKDQQMVELLLNYGFHADVKDSRKKTPMYYAYASCSLNMCKFLLSKGVNINSTIYLTHTILHIAVSNKAAEQFIEYLLKQGANVNAATSSNSTPLHIACENGSEGIVKLLLKYKADIDVKDKDGFTPLHKAIGASNKRIAEYLICSGSNINATTNLMVTPLHLAVLNENSSMVLGLLKCPVDVNVRDNTKKTALHYAVSNRSLYCIPAFLNKNPDLEDMNNKLAFCLAIIGNDSKQILPMFLSRRFTIVVEDFERFEIPEPLRSIFEKNSVQEEYMRVSQDLLKTKATTQALFQYQVMRVSVKKGFVEIVKQLLKQDLDLNTLLEDGQTLLHDAIESSQWGVAEELLKHGADVNVANIYKSTPLHISTRFKSENVAFLLKHKANLEARNEDGETPLHLAADKGNVIAEFILKAGANVNSANKKGCTPLHLAAKSGHKHIVQLLLYHGAKIDVKNGRKETPLDVARANSEDRVPSLLLEYVSKCNFGENSTFRMYNTTERILMRHVMKMHAANLYDIEVEVPPHMSDFRKDCEDEVQSMKSEEIGRNISLFDLLRKRLSKVAAFMRNEDTMERINTKGYEEKFPLYSSMLEMRIREGKTRNHLLDQGATCLKSLLEHLELEIPDLVLQEIFSFLSNRDLRNFIFTSPIEIEENSSNPDSEQSQWEKLLDVLPF